MRAHARYPTTMPCWLEVRDGQRINGWVEDISTGGVGVRVSQELPPVDDFTLLLTVESEPLRLACSVRHTRDLWQSRFVHARFRRLSARQQEAIDGIVGKLATAQRPEELRSLPFRGLRRWLARRS